MLFSALRAKMCVRTIAKYVELEHGRGRLEPRNEHLKRRERDCIHASNRLARLAAPETESTIVSLLLDKRVGLDVRKNAADILHTFATVPAVSAFRTVAVDCSDDYSIRSWALDHLNDLKWTPVTNAERVVSVRGSVEECARLGNAAIPQLVAEIEAMGTHDTWCSHALSLIRDERAVGALVAVMHGSPAPPARCAASHALGEIGVVTAVPALIDALDLEREYSVLCSVIAALGKLHDTRAIPHLVSKLLPGQEEYLCTAAANALDGFGHGELSNDAIARLCLGQAMTWQHYDSQYKRIRDRCFALGQGAVGPLMEELRTYTGSHINKRQRFAIEVLVGLRHVGVVPYLVLALDDRGYRSTAIDDLYTLGDPRGREALLKRASTLNRCDDDWAARAIGKWREKSLAKPLMEAFQKATHSSKMNHGSTYILGSTADFAVACLAGLIDLGDEETNAALRDLADSWGEPSAMGHRIREALSAPGSTSWRYLGESVT